MHELYPKLVVPAVPSQNNIKFLMEQDSIEIDGEFCDLVWEILSLCNGHNSISDITKQCKTEKNEEIINSIIQELMDLHILYDSRQLFLHFHSLSGSPDIYPQELTYKEVTELEGISPQFKEEKERYFFPKDMTRLTDLILQRKSCRNFSAKELFLWEIGNICYHAYSIPFHTVPSAGGLYPLKLYIIVSKQQGKLPEGYYQYDSLKDELIRYKEDVDIEQLKYCFNDEKLPFSSSVQIVIAANLLRTSTKYSNRGYRLTLIEAGHVGQNISLCCESMGLGSCELGGVLDKEIAEELEMGEDVPLLSIAVGYPDYETEKNPYEEIEFSSVIEKEYMGENKPVKSCFAYPLPNNASFFAATSDYGSCDKAGAVSSSFAMAKAKAIIEGYERYVSENIRNYIVCPASHFTKEEWIHPEKFHKTGKEPECKKFDENLEIAWSKGKYLVSGKEVWIPSDVVFYGEYEDIHRICYSNSSGIAAHTDIQEAIRSGMLELIERDAIMRNWYERIPPKRLSEDILPVHIQKRIQKWKKDNQELMLFSLPSSYGPSFLAVILGKEFPYFVSGASTHFDTEKALLKTVQEAEFSLYTSHPPTDTLFPQDVATPLDHGMLYASGQYLDNIKWLWTENEVLHEIPEWEMDESELIQKLNPIVVEMKTEGRIKVVKVLSENCLPIYFGYQGDYKEHPVMKELNVKEESFFLPHYFA